MADETHPLLDSASDSTTPRYRYSALPAGKSLTRILHLEPGDETDILNGSLRPYSLGWRTPQYQALSYCWGDASQHSPGLVLYVEGKELPVTANAYNALKHSRSRTRAVLLWLDQVCINQADLAERSQQINLMGLVFGKAAEVMVHLGEDLEGAELLFEFMHAVGEDAEKRIGWLSWWWKRRQRPFPSASPLCLVFGNTRLLQSTRARLSVHQDELVAFRNALFDLLALPWFGRMWIVQEAALARRLTIRLGDRCVGWYGLHNTVADVPHHYHDKLGGLLPRTAVTGLKSVLALQMLMREMRKPVPWKYTYQNMARLFSSGASFVSLETYREALHILRRQHIIPVLDLLRAFRHQLATDDRDKLFGILGLASANYARGFFLRHLTDQAGIIACCKYFALMHIVHTGTLDVLSASCSSGTAHATLPFWCPDWSHPTPDCDTKYSVGTYDYPPHRAGLHASPAKVSVLQGESPWPLVIEGFQIDEVDAVVTGVFDVHNFKDPAANIWEEWRTFAMREPSPELYALSDERWDAYWRTLVYNSDGGGGFAPPALDDTIKTFFEDSSACTDEVRSEFGGRFTWVARKLYRTKRGYLGNGCSNVKPGDKVFICTGGRFPLLLREDRMLSGTMMPLDIGWGTGEEHLTLLGHKLIGGDTYVHGLCEGEAIGIARAESIEPAMVCLS